jgi:hypothetical protein
VDFSIHRGCWNQCPADIKGSYVKNVHFIKVCGIEDNISVEIQKKVWNNCDTSARRGNEDA